MSRLTKQSQKSNRLRRNRGHLGINKPRLIVNKSNKHIRAQIIDAKIQKTILGVGDEKLSAKDIKTDNKMTPRQTIAFQVGEMIAKKAVEKKITEVIFDRGSYKYHGIVKALAEGARKGGLKF